MTENIPPSTGAKPTTTTAPATANAAAAANNTTSTSTSDRGIPYYESLRRSLRDTIQKKRSLDRTLATLEDQIHRSETTYLEETSSAGNIIKGFDNYIKAAATANAAASGTISGSQAGGTRRKAVVSETDRVFSRSSVSWREVNGGESGPGSAVSTPGRATPVASAGGASATGPEKDGRKKKKSVAGTAAAGDDEEGGRVTKRQKISFTRKGHDD